jgi:hypothetical protein
MMTHHPAFCVKHIQPTEWFLLLALDWLVAHTTLFSAQIVQEHSFILTVSRRV